MKKAIFLLLTVLAMGLGTALTVNGAATTTAPEPTPMPISAPAQPANEIELTVWIKPAKDASAPWQESLKLEPSTLVNFRVDVKNVSATVLKNVSVQKLLSTNLIYKDNLKINNLNLKGDITKGIIIGDINKGQTKTLTFDVEVAGNDKLMFGQNDLVGLFAVTMPSRTYIDTAKIVVWRQGLAGTTTGPITPQAPSSIHTGLESKLMDFVFLPIILATIALIIFRRQWVFAINGFNHANFEAEKFGSEMALRKKIQEVKNKI